MACLVLAALIWGFAFVSQVQGMDSTTPLFFGATRFTLGSISLIPLLWFRRSTIAEQERKRRETQGKPSITLGNGAIVAMPKWAGNPIVVSIICGIVLFTASTVQQYGILYSGSAGRYRLHHRSIHRHDSAACLRHIASTSAPQRHHQRRHLRYRLLPAVRHRRIRIHHPGGHGAAVHRGPLRGAHPRHRHLWTRHGPHPAFIRADHHHRDHQLDWLYHRRIHRLGRCRAKLDRHRLRGRLLRWRSLYASGHRPTTCASDQSVRDHVARIVLLRSRRGASAGRNHRPLEPTSAARSFSRAPYSPSCPSTSSCMRPNANRQTSAGLRGLANLRRAIDIAMNVLHLRFDILQTSRAIKQRLRMLRQLRVRQIRLITQRMLQTRPIIHGDGAELHLHRRVMRSGR